MVLTQIWVTTIKRRDSCDWLLQVICAVAESWQRGGVFITVDETRPTFLSCDLSASLSLDTHFAFVVLFTLQPLGGGRIPLLEVSVWSKNYFSSICSQVLAERGLSGLCFYSKRFLDHKRKSLCFPSKLQSHPIKTVQHPRGVWTYTYR